MILGNRFRIKYRNTKALLILQFCWFIICATTFLFFLIRDFNRAQNIVMGAFLGGGLVVFFYKFKRIFENPNHS
jgi:hypothetical protein